MPGETVPIDATADDATADDATDEDCGSLRPLLRALPTARADGRNPLMVKSAGVDVCVTDGMTANKEQWFLFGVTLRLRLELAVRSNRAAALTASEAAAGALLSLFSQFAPGAVAN